MKKYSHHVVNFLKLTQQKCHYFFEFLTLWYLKLRFVLNTFRTKTCKSSHYGTRTLLLVPTTKSQSRVHTRARLCFLILAWFSMSFLLSTSYYFYGNNTLSSPTLAQVNTNSICEGSFSSPKYNLYAIHVSNYVLGLRQEFIREGQTETAIILCKLNKSL